MRSLLGLAVAMVVALGIVAGSVFGASDRAVMTSPPEAVAEGFVRELATERFDRALPYLDDRLREQVGKAGVRSATHRFESSAGYIEDARGEGGTLEKEQATASVIVKTERKGEHSFGFRLRFTEGVWKIAGLPDELR